MYTWGSAAGEIAGDKFEGRFKCGVADGYGRTSFNHGGWHKVSSILFACIGPHSASEFKLVDHYEYREWTSTKQYSENARQGCMCKTRFSRGLCVTFFMQGLYQDGKMNGFGVLLTTEGWEYMGKWKDDELHGRFVCQYTFSYGSEKIVQTYSNGEFQGTSEYNAALDWCEIESLALEAANVGQTMAQQARGNIDAVTRIARRAKESQLLAQDHADEGRYMLKASIKYKDYLGQWFGLRQWIWPTDA